MNVTRIWTQGRPHSKEYVMEYRISYGMNGLDYADYKEFGGDVMVRHFSLRRSGKRTVKCVHKESVTANLTNSGCSLFTSVNLIRLMLLMH